MSYVSPYGRFSELERAVAQRDALAAKLAEYIRVHELTVAAKETWREEAHRIAGDLSAANAKLASVRQIKDGLELTADYLHKQLVAANAEIVRLKAETTK